MTQSENRVKAATGGWIVFASVSGGISLIAGAFAAHGLDAASQATEIGWLHTGSLYEALHALAMLAVASLTAGGLLRARPAYIAQWSFMTGSIVFPSALYGLALHGPRWLGAIAPIGGLAFITGWAALAWAAFAKRKA
jgi:uncharacterized membrane protein YgdD (TMEM256/DUF423 family)